MKRSFVFYTKNVKSDKTLYHSQKFCVNPSKTKNYKDLTKLLDAIPDNNCGVAIGYMLAEKWYESKGCDYVVFKNKTYPVVELNIKIGTINVSVDSLSDVLCPDGNWENATDEARAIDNDIYFYVPDELINESIEVLTEFVIKHAN